MRRVFPLGRAPHRGQIRAVHGAVTRILRRKRHGLALRVGRRQFSARRTRLQKSTDAFLRPCLLQCYCTAAASILHRRQLVLVLVAFAHRAIFEMGLAALHRIALRGPGFLFWAFYGPPFQACSYCERRSGGRKGRPYSGKRNRSVGSANSGAKLEPHQKQILQTQAPSGAGRTRTQALLVLRAGNFLPGLRDNPRNRGPGVRRI